MPTTVDVVPEVVRTNRDHQVSSGSVDVGTAEGRRVVPRNRFDVGSPSVQGLERRRVIVEIDEVQGGARRAMASG